MPGGGKLDLRDMGRPCLLTFRAAAAGSSGNSLKLLAVASCIRITSCWMPPWPGSCGLPTSAARRFKSARRLARAGAPAQPLVLIGSTQHSISTQLTAIASLSLRIGTRAWVEAPVLPGPGRPLAWRCGCVPSASTTAGDQPWTASGSMEAASGGGGGGAPPPGSGVPLRHMLAVDDDDFDCSIELAVPGELEADADAQDSEGPPAKRARVAAGSSAAAAAAAPAADATEEAAAKAAAAVQAAAEVAADRAAASTSAATTITCPASAVVLKLHSEVFRCGLAHHHSPRAGSSSSLFLCYPCTGHTAQTVQILLPLRRRWIKGWTGGEKGALRIECEDRQEAEAFQQLLAFVHSAGRTLPDGGWLCSRQSNLRGVGCLLLCTAARLAYGDCRFALELT